MDQREKESKDNDIISFPPKNLILQMHLRKALSILSLTHTHTYIHQVMMENSKRKLMMRMKII